MSSDKSTETGEKATFKQSLERSDKKPGHHLEKYKWKPGVSPNPAGRPKGSRSKFTDRFFRDIAQDWQEHGLEAVERCREKDPSTYLRVIASLMPKDIKIQHEHTELTTVELEARLRQLARIMDLKPAAVDARSNVDAQQVIDITPETVG